MPGARGPLPKANAIRRDGKELTPVYRANPSQLPEAPPDDLSKMGVEVWRDAAACSWIQGSDRLAVYRLAQLEDERAAMASEIANTGLMLSRPVVTPRGDVVGEEMVANPLLRETRRIDAAILELRKALGLDPMSRARLGVRVADLAGRVRQLTTRDPAAPDPRFTHPLEEP